jgi:AcrR family transcriptional regulator
MVDYQTELIEGVSTRTVTASKSPPGGRSRILEVARAAFVERGFADVSMQEIANAAGLTKAAIYYHFTDKEALFEQVLIGELDRLIVGVAAQLAPGPPLRDQLYRVARFAFETGRGDFGRLLADAHRYCASDRLWAIKDHVNHPYSLIRGAFEQAQQRGEIRAVDLDVTLALFFGMLAGQLKGPEFGPVIAKSAEELADLVADMVMHGIAADPRR